MASLFKPCGVPDCNGNAHHHDQGHKGFCNKHYKRLYRYGDPLKKMRASNGEVKRFYRDVVLAHEGHDCLVWPYYRNEFGYGVLQSEGRTSIVPRQVCEDAHGQPPTPQHQSAHSCGNGHLGCVSKHHLSWKTRPENEADKLIHGTHNRGVKNGRAKLSEDQAREILSLKGLVSQRILAQRYNVIRQTISDIHRGENWGWIK